VQNGWNWCKSLCHEVASEFLATKTPDWPRLDLNSCFGVFYTIWVHLVPLVCLTKLHAKPGGVVQKFVPSSRVGIFLSECSRSTPLDPNLMFRCVCTIWMHLGQFGCVTTLSAIWAKLVQKFVPRNRVGIFCNEYTWSTPLDSKFILFCVLYYLGAFGTVWLPYKTPCKMGRSGAKVRAMKSFRNFFETTTPDPPHWTLTSCFGAFHTIWVHLG